MLSDAGPNGESAAGESGAPPAEDPSRLADARARLQDIIGDLEDHRLQPLLENLGAFGLQVVEAPREGLIMMRVRDSGGTVFHLGEVLVTQARVAWQGHTGWGLCLGARPLGALALAGLEALAQGGEGAAAPRLRELVETLRQEVEQARGREKGLAALTRVAFETMAEER